MQIMRFLRRNIRKTAQHDRLDSKYQHKAVHINVLTLDNPYQTQTSGNPIWIIFFSWKIWQKLEIFVSDFSIFVFFGVLAQKRCFWALWHSLLIFGLILTCNTALERYYVNYARFVHFEKSQKMKAIEQKKRFFSFSSFASSAFIFRDI